MPDLTFWVGFLGSANQKPGAAVSRVDDQGVLLDTPNGFPVVATNDNELYTSLLFQGDFYYATWKDADSNLRGARLDPVTGHRLDGPATDPGAILASVPAYTEPGVALAASPSGVAVFVNGRAVRVGTNGTVLDALPIRVTDYGWDQAVSAVFDGTNYFVIWESGSLLRASRFALDGTVLDPPDDFNMLPGGIEVCTTGSPRRPRLFRSGARPSSSSTAVRRSSTLASTRPTARCSLLRRAPVD